MPGCNFNSSTLSIAIDCMVSACTRSLVICVQYHRFSSCCPVIHLLPVLNPVVVYRLLFHTRSLSSQDASPDSQCPCDMMTQLISFFCCSALSDCTGLSRVIAIDTHRNITSEIAWDQFAATESPIDFAIDRALAIQTLSILSVNSCWYLSGFSKTVRFSYYLVHLPIVKFILERNDLPLPS